MALTICVSEHFGNNLFFKKKKKKKPNNPEKERLIADLPNQETRENEWPQADLKDKGKEQGPDLLVNTQW